MNNIIFNTELITGAKGDKGDTGVSYEVPTGAIIGYDGAGIPDGYEETTEPPVPSGGGGLDFTLTEIVAQVTDTSSQTTATETLSEGIYLVLYSTSMNDGPSADNITYSGSDYTILHSYKTDNSYPTAQIDIVEITASTTVTISYQTRAHGGYAIYKINGLNNIGNVALEQNYSPVSGITNTAMNVDVTALTISTSYILVTVFASDRFSADGYSGAGFAGGDIEMSYYPMFSQFGDFGYVTGFAMIIKTEQLERLKASLDNNGLIVGFVCEIS